MRLRDQVQAKLTEQVSKNERLERELNSKLAVLNSFEDAKRVQVTALREEIKDLTLAARRAEMGIEDILGEMLRFDQVYQSEVARS